MVSVCKINETENTYNKKISFQSRFVPNRALEEAFTTALQDTYRARLFARVVNYILNDGKDDLIQLTSGRKGSGLIINNKRVNYCSYYDTYKANSYSLYPQCDSLINYFIHKTKLVSDTTELSSKELKVVKPLINKLNADLNEDDVTNNPQLLNNLQNNLAEINEELRMYTFEVLDKLKAKIYGKTA